DARFDADPVSRSSPADGRRFSGRTRRRGLRTDPALARRARPAERPVSAVVSDSSPLNYLALLSDFDLLRQIYHTVVIPPAVHREVVESGADYSVRQTVAAAP